jgi:hypothetical protein
MRDERRYKVIPLGNGRYRVTTTIVEEMDEGELVERGIQPPAADVPWIDPAPVHAADRAAALRHWSAVLGGYDPRLSGRMSGFIQELGLPAIFEAIDQVAAMNLKPGVSLRYAEFIRVLRQIRERRGAG